MDIIKTYKRKDVNQEYTWDLSSFFKTENEYREFFKEVEEDIDLFLKNYKGQLNKAETIEKALLDYMDLSERISRLMSFNYLAVSVDTTDEENNLRYMEAANRANQISVKLSFFQVEILKNQEEELRKVYEINPELKCFIEDLIRNKSLMLSDQVEAVISSLGQPLNSFMSIYEAGKHQDMTFPDFQVEGKNYELSYNIYEGLMEGEADAKVRRQAFRVFSDSLEDYKNYTAACYLAHCQKEKALASLRGFDSVIDYLLFEQKVPRELYNRQIDLIMEELSPIMRRYARLLKKVHGLDEIRYEDLKIDLDPSFSSKISVPEAQELIREGLAVLGDEYMEIIDQAFENRWIDYVNNHGKETGAFCASPYAVHSYILISWTGNMEETMVLSHELGHAGHFQLAQKENNILDTDPSTYFVEAPSTTNELIMANYLLEKAQSPKERRYVLSQIISRTYYHNFVTHLLEAAYQREVYKLIDQGKSFSANTLSDIYMDVLRDFWGDDVVLTKGAELTWMRQPHYYMGLYPYTYSAGLTIGTEVSQRILSQGQEQVDKWLKALKAGGTKDPVGLAELAGVDITTDQPLKNTIKYIGSIVDEMEKITDELD